MFRVFETNAKLMNVKVISPKLTVGTVYNARKEGDDFVNSFMECRLIGNANKKFAKNLKEKEKFTIVEGVIKQEYFTKNNGEKGSKFVMTIFDIKRFEPKEVTPVVDEDMPF